MSKKPTGKKPDQTQEGPTPTREQLMHINQRIAMIKSTALTLAVQLNHGTGDIAKVKKHFEEFKTMLGLVK